MRARLLTCIVALLAALAGRLGAFSLEENIILDDKGGCKVALVMQVPEKYQALYKAVLKAVSAEGSGGLMDEAAVRKYFAVFPEFSIESYHVFRRRDNVMVQLMLSAKDAQEAFATGALGYMLLGPSMDVIGDTELFIVLPRPERPPPAAMRRKVGELARALGGIEFIVRLTTPTEMLETTGRKSDYNRCAWRISFDELLDNTYKDIKARW